MPDTTYLEKTKNDTIEMAQVLKKIPESKKESVLMLVTGYALGLESESENRTVAAG